MPAATSLIVDMFRQPVHTLLLHCHVGAMPSWDALSGEAGAAGHVKHEPEESSSSFHHGPGIQMSTIDRAPPRFPQTWHHGSGVKVPADSFAPCGSPSVGIWRADSIPTSTRS